MKKLIVVLGIAFTLAACGNAESENTAKQDTVETINIETMPMAAGPKDPVCDMDKDSTWTEYTIYENDTVWFCSGTCKQAFEGNTAKYAPKLKS